MNLPWKYLSDVSQFALLIDFTVYVWYKVRRACTMKPAILHKLQFIFESFQLLITKRNKSECLTCEFSY